MSAGGPQAALDLARALLSPDRVGVTFEETPPDPAIEQLGALAGFGAAADDYDIRVSVYVLDGWGRGRDHIEMLTARAEAHGRQASTAVNGQLLFVGTAPRDDEGARFLLNDLCSAFAGRE